MSGSDGVALDGMYHEEHALPRFVHARSRDQLRLPSVDPQGRDARSSTSTRTGPEGPRGRAVPARDLDAVVPAGRRSSAPQFAQMPAPDELRRRPDRLVPRDHPAGAGAADAPRRRRPRPTPSGTSPARWMPPTSGRRTGPRRGNRDRERAVPVLPRARPGAAPAGALGATTGGTLALDRGRAARRPPRLRRSASRADRASIAIGPRWPGRDGHGRDPLAWTTPGRWPSSRPDRRRPGGAAGRERALREGGPGDGQHLARPATSRPTGIRVLFVLPQAWTDAFIPLTSARGRGSRCG